VAVAALTITDRLAIRIYVNVDGRVVTLHTENNHLCQVVTTFSKGLTSLNNLTRQVQFLGTGTSGTDFNIVSSLATHTFNLPIASATNTGKLSSTDWSTFNAKQPAGNYVTLDTTQTISGLKTFSGASVNIAPTSGDGGILNLKRGAYTGGINDYTSLISQGDNFGIASLTSSSNRSILFDFASITSGILRTYTLPNASGIIALTSNLSSYVPYSGATANVNLGLYELLAQNAFLNGVSGVNGGNLFLRQDVDFGQSAGYTTLYSTGKNLGFVSYVGSFTYNALFSLNSLTNNSTRTYTLPDASGTLALTSDLTGGTVTSVAALTIGTTGTDLSSSVANGTTTPVITLNVPTASATNRGALSSADWTTFNNKYNLPTFSNGSILFIKFSTIAENNPKFFWNDTNSYLGIGTNVPTAGVTSFSSTPATQFKAAGVAPAMTFSNTLTAATYAAVFGLATSNNDFVSGTATGDFAIANQSTSAGAIVFGTGTTEKMRMTSAGTFSIGNTNSSFNLDVTGTGRFTTTLTANKLVAGNASTDNVAIFTTYDEGKALQLKGSTGDLIFVPYFNPSIGAKIIAQNTAGSANTPLSLIASSINLLSPLSGTSATFSGSLGVNSTIRSTGQTDPSSGVGMELFYRAADTSSYIQSYDRTNGAWKDVRIYGNTLYFGTQGTNSLTINTSGNVGIGSTDPGALLVLRSTQANSSNFAWLTFRNGANGFGTWGFYKSGNNNLSLAYGTDSDTPMNNATAITFQYGGAVLMGITTNSASARLALDAIGMAVYDGSNYRQCYMNGSTMAWWNGSNQGTLSSAGVWTDASDISIKKDVVDIKYGLDAVLELKPRSYKMKNDDLEQVGFIAQEVEQVIKELVSTDNKGMKGLSYGQLTAILTKAIQEQTQIIKDLEARIVSLESK
jgi:hypothetical protein